jgi:precorrin-2 dehydrogenase/sirohydrochlorin ferrochelatase
MIPIALNGECLSIGLAGRGPALRRRLSLLREGGGRHIAVFCDAPDAELTPLVRLPGPDDLADLDVLWITGLDETAAAALARQARAQRVLVNVEDQPALCDFHSVAELRRGDLLLTVSTGASSPGLARAVRDWLARQFGPEWAGRTSEIAAHRQGWRRDNASVEKLSALTEAFVQSAGWLA